RTSSRRSPPASATTATDSTSKPCSRSRDRPSPEPVRDLRMLKIFLAGRTGEIGRELIHTLAPLGAVVAPPHAEFDLTRPDSMRQALRQARPGIIVNAAAFSSMDESEAQPDLALRVNAAAPAVMAEEAKRLDALLLHYSSAYVFDGTATRPYVEDDAPRPINAYGRTKLAGEQAIAAAGARHIILRLSWIHSL